MSVVCEICGTEMQSKACKIVCPNCGRMVDCSDVLPATAHTYICKFQDGPMEGHEDQGHMEPRRVRMFRRPNSPSIAIYFHSGAPVLVSEPTGSIYTYKYTFRGYGTRDEGDGNKIETLQI